MFIQTPPTEEELEMMADYMLWGKDKDGKNGKQQGLGLHSRNGTWDASPTESLDALMEMPTFNETALAKLGSTQFRAKKEVFSREEAIAEAPLAVRDSLLSLFLEIDQLDFLISQYELNHNKRTKPIRAELIKRFSAEEIERM